MPLDPVLQRLIDVIPPVPAGPPDFPQLRRQADDLIPVILGPDGLLAVGSVEERVIQGLHGDVPIRIYRPNGTPTGTFHYLHGGGWVVGSLANTEPVARRLCRETSMVVVTSTYRLAPEMPFPAAYEDAMAASTWVLSNASELGGATGPVVIGGDSAGGNLAAVICMGLRERDHAALGLSVNDSQHRTTFDLQLLLYPVVDLRPEAMSYASRIADADPTLTLEAATLAIEAYTSEADRSNWRVSPAAASSLAGLPPAVIAVLSVDPVRDEAVQYAESLKAARVPVELVEFEHLTHGFGHFAGIVPAAAEAFKTVLKRMDSLLRSTHEARS